MRRGVLMSGKPGFWKLRFLLGVLVLLIFGRTQLCGQSQAITATLSGSVLDPTGQSISGAKLTLSNPERAVSRTFTTGDSGLYTFTLLPPATYSLEVEAGGFKRYK